MDGGAKVIHVDVMDGHFVPPISFGALVVDALREQVHEAAGWIDVHLMVDRPEHQVSSFAEAGADSINVHVEATPHIRYALDAVRDAGCQAGLALNPGTPAEVVVPVADIIDLALCMTVNPGWGGQAFIPGSERKVARLRELLGEGTAITVDGGIDAATAGPCARSGSDAVRGRLLGVRERGPRRRLPRGGRRRRGGLSGRGVPSRRHERQAHVDVGRGGAGAPCLRIGRARVEPRSPRPRCLPAGSAEQLLHVGRQRGPLAARVELSHRQPAHRPRLLHPGKQHLRLGGHAGRRAPTPAARRSSGWRRAAA